MTVISRRHFAGAGGLLPLTHQGATETVALRNKKYSDLRGFNYQPSWGTSGLEIWRQFDSRMMSVELARGKRYFPGMTAIRLWLSWGAFMRGYSRFAQNFETALEIAQKYGLRVMPVLLNRWHSRHLDYGGIYLDHFLPGASWLQRTKDPFRSYLEAIVGKYARDPRIFAWDLCNEPFTYNSPESPSIKPVREAEMAWLEMLHTACKHLGAQAPITVGFHGGMDMIDKLCDVFSIHPYWSPPQDKRAVAASRTKFESFLDARVRIANQFNKPLMATETCWGSLNDQERVEIIRYTLSELKKRSIGWLAYVLHHSLIADAHRPEYGPVGHAGNLAFIEADGSLRPGHDAFNDF